MSFRGKLWILVISAAIAAYAVIGGMPLVGGLLTTNAQQPVNDENAQLRIVESVLQHIQNDYVDEPNMDKVRLGGLRGLAGGLDPYSSFLTPEQVRDFDAKTNKTGIGAEFSQISGYLYVISTVKGSPADRAGIKGGDVIEYIDSKATRDISLYDAKQLIIGDPGSTVALRVLRAGEKPQTIKVARGTYKLPASESHIEGSKVGVLKVYSLEDGSANDIRSQVQSLTRQGVSKIVLDLRGVATGTLPEAAAVANLFVKSGVLAKVIGKESSPIQTFTADPSKAVFDGNLVVLIDIGTAGPGEVVASAIVDNKRGEAVGERTFGAGTEQKLFTLSSGGGYLLTVAKWAAPDGTPFLGQDRATTGVKPTIEVKRQDAPDPLQLENLVDQQDEQKNPTPQASPANKTVQPKTEEDLQMKKALEILQGPAAKAAGE